MSHSYMSLLHFNPECYSSLLLTMSVLHVSPPHQYSMSIFHVTPPSRHSSISLPLFDLPYLLLHVAPRCRSSLLTTPYRSSMSILHVALQCYSSMSLLHVTPLCHSSMLSLHVALQCHSSISLLHDEPPCCSSISHLHVISPCRSSMSIPLCHSSM